MKINLFLSNYWGKGGEVIHQSKQLGAENYFITLTKYQGREKPEHVDKVFYVESFDDISELLVGLGYSCRSGVVQSVFPLDDYCLDVAAIIREYFVLGGIGVTATRSVRDKLTMRSRADKSGIKVPRFHNTWDRVGLAKYFETTQGPWMLKPRGEAGSVQIKKLTTADEAWEAIDGLGDRKFDFLLEEFIVGDVYHADAVVFAGECLDPQCHTYDRPPFKIWNEGGAFVTRSLAKSTKEDKALVGLLKDVVRAMSFEYGIVHGEFIYSQEHQTWFFLEIAGRPAGAYIDKLIEVRRGYNLWREWAKVEKARAEGLDYTLEPQGDDKLAGILTVCLSRVANPEPKAGREYLSWQKNNGHHYVGIYTSSSKKKLEAAFQDVSKELTEDIIAIIPPTEKPA